MSGSFPSGPGYCNGTAVATVNSAGTAVTGGASNVKGSYVQLTASAPTDVRAIGVCIQDTGNTTRHCFVDIAVGGAGSEKVILSNLMVEGSTNGSTGTDYLFPVNIPAGTRIAARAQNGSATADGPSVSLVLFDGGFDADGFAGVDDIGSVTATTFGSLLTASATVNTKGTYVQLSAATAVDYEGFWIRPSAPSSGAAAQQNLLDIAIGGSGSEVVIVPNLMINCTLLPAFPMFFGPIWMPIPAGTRIAARIQSATASATAGLQLYGIYR